MVFSVFIKQYTEISLPAVKYVSIKLYLVLEPLIYIGLFLL